MQIDKSRFLFLTSSLAATAAAVVVSTSACGTTTTATDTDAGTDDPTADDSGTDGGSSDGSAGDGSSSTDASDAAVACLGTDGTAPFCGPEIEGVDGGPPAKCQFECSNVSKIFKTGVAVEISACLDKDVPDPTVEGACFAGVAPCVEGALAKACEDDTAAAYCTTLLAGCGDAAPVPSQADCIGVVSALSAAGKTSLSDCTAEGGCGGCFDSVAAGTLFVP